MGGRPTAHPEDPDPQIWLDRCRPDSSRERTPGGVEASDVVVSRRKRTVFVDATQSVIDAAAGSRPRQAKRKRTMPHQLDKLLSSFAESDAPTFAVRDQLAAECLMTNREVQVWFQNRRAKVAREKQRQAADSPHGQGSERRASATPPLISPGSTTSSPFSGSYESPTPSSPAASADYFAPLGSSRGIVHAPAFKPIEPPTRLVASGMVQAAASWNPSTPTTCPNAPVYGRAGDETSWREHDFSPEAPSTPGLLSHRTPTLRNLLNPEGPPQEKLETFSSGTERPSSAGKRVSARAAAYSSPLRPFATLRSAPAGAEDERVLAIDEATSSPKRLSSRRSSYGCGLEGRGESRPASSSSFGLGILAAAASLVH